MSFSKNDDYLVNIRKERLDAEDTEMVLNSVLEENNVELANISDECMLKMIDDFMTGNFISVTVDEVMDNSFILYVGDVYGGFGVIRSRLIGASTYKDIFSEWIETLELLLNSEYQSVTVPMGCGISLGVASDPWCGYLLTVTGLSDEEDIKKAYATKEDVICALYEVYLQFLRCLSIAHKKNALNYLNK